MFLVLNCGSSSVKFQIIDPSNEAVHVNGLVERMGTPNAKLKLKFPSKGSRKEESKLKDSDYASVLRHWIPKSILNHKLEFNGIGHRVVHGGEHFKNSILINDEVINKISDCNPLAPLHNPNNLLGIKIMREIYPSSQQVAVFDTSFHADIKPEVYRYAIPDEYYKNDKIRRYGFHGSSHRYVAQKASEILGIPVQNLNLVTAHLGNGCSVCAVKGGISVDTSMGFSPLEGLIMGTRSGDIDPTVLQFLADKYDLTLPETLKIINSKSGLLGISGYGDSRDVEDEYLKLGENTPSPSKLAIDMFCYRLSKYIGSYLIPLDGQIDALVFTGGIGEKSCIKRGKVMEYLKGLGFQLDREANDDNGQKTRGRISSRQSGKIALVIPTNEELVIAQETKKLMMTS